jgi:AacA4 family aminoglycoside N(6')-acetyltransferase
MAGQGEIQLRPMTDADIPMLHGWMRRPHVLEWWDADEAALPLERIRERYCAESLAAGKVTPYIVLHDGQPLGYAQSYVAMGAGGGWWEDEVDPGVRGIDQFIADPGKLGQGLGTRMVKRLVQMLFADPAVTKVQTDPDPANARAIRCYQKAGFHAVRVIGTPDGAALYMMQER